MKSSTTQQKYSVDRKPSVERSSTERRSTDQSFDSSIRKLSNGKMGKSLCEGFLKLKEKGYFGIDTYNKFYFLVIGQGLYKTQSANSSTVKDAYPLKDSKSVEDISNANGFFVFLSNGQKLSFLSENPFDKQRWMASISSAATKEKVPHSLVLDSLNDAGVGSDVDAIIRAVNDKALKLFEYSKKEELLGQNVSILMSPTLAKLHDGFIQKYKETGQKTLIGNVRKLVGRKKDGSLFPVEISLGETEQEETRYLAIFRPVTEEKKEVVLTESELKNTSEVEELKKKLEQDIEEQMEIVKQNVAEGFDGLKKKLKLMMEEDQKKKVILNSLYEDLKKVKAESKLLKEELAIYRKEGTVSIHQLLRNNQGRQAFLEFCHELRCEENLMFWIEAETYKKEKSPQEMKDKGKYIYDTYLSSKSSNQLNTSSQTLEFIEKNLNSADVNLFSELQKEILFLLADNAFKKFCVSGIGKAIIGNLEEHN